MSKHKRTKQAKPGSKLPKRMYIWEDDPDSIAYTNPADSSAFVDGNIVGTYELVAVSRFVLKATLEPVK